MRLGACAIRAGACEDQRREEAPGHRGVDLRARHRRAEPARSGEARRAAGVLRLLARRLAAADRAASPAHRARAPDARDGHRQRVAVRAGDARRRARRARPRVPRPRDRWHRHRALGGDARLREAADHDPALPRHERCLAALGPKMLELSAARALGALPYFTPVAHTRFARQTIGEGALLATELACVIDTDSERGRASARAYAALYLGLSNYTNNLLRHGFTAADIADGGSDQLIDAVIPHGSAGQVADVARAHLDAGADHVALQPVGVEGIPRQEWTALAAALID